ncbi:hypothetical protein CL634_07615 [bacterium]|nr:hypothetical protein [bacterium]
MRILILLSTILILAGCSHALPAEQALPVADIEVEDIIDPVVEVESLEDLLIKDKERLLPEVLPKISDPIIEPAPTSKKIPATHDQNVTFVSQSPYATWDDLHQEACEEASMIMVVRHFENQALDKAIMEEEIQKFVVWQAENGYDIDVTAGEVKEIMKTYFNYEVEVTGDVTVDRIKQELAAGKLIIVPAAGRELGNPYFTQPGPLYHMLVIRGYDRNQFITNDPGTRRGARYKYKYQTVINAVHDWNDGDVENGKKLMVLVSPN